MEAMNSRLQPDYLDPFLEVARLICGGEPPAWLAEQLWRWRRWLYRDRQVEETRPTREEMRSTLLEVENAALLLTEALAPSWTREFLDASSRRPIADPERLVRALEDLSDRACEARDGPDLATASGVTKPGPGKARPHAMSPQTLCAIMIWDAWKHVHGTEPGLKSRPLAQATEVYWQSAGREVRPHVQEPLAFWAYHFKKAAASPVGSLRTEWRRHLVEAERSWRRRRPDSHAA